MGDDPFDAADSRSHPCPPRVCAPLVGLLLGAAGLEVRTRRGTSGRGAAPLIVGGCLAFLSLFGLLWGVASVGVVGGLVTLSALPIMTVDGDALTS
jgi:hypothetical protein